MSKNSVVKMEDFYVLPNPGLKTYFDNVVKGNDVEFRTPFYHGKEVQSIISDWMPTVEKLNNKWPTLVNFENDLAEKVGPMSIMFPLKDRIDDIDHYYEDILLPQKPIPQSAIAAVLKEWNGVRGIEPRSQLKTVELMKKSTNSGSPYFTKRRAVVNKTIPCSVEPIRNSNYVQHLGGMSNTKLMCAILGWRGQEGGPNNHDVKQRVVWMFPFAANVMELQVYQPLIELSQRYNIVPAWVSMDSVDDSITKLFDSKGRDDDIICTDFSKFDQHFNNACQECAKTILSHILNSSVSSSNWISDVFPIKYNIPLNYNWDEFRFGSHGMASGSGGTNADETLTHRALQYEVAISNNAKLNPNSMCLGDDGVLSYPGINVEDVVRSYTAHGLEMNESKQYVSKQDCIYLRRWHHADYRENGKCVGVYSTARAIGRLCEQERFYDPDMWSKEMVALRQLSIIENCKFHPCKEDFVQFCMKGDKYRLGLDIPGFMDNIESIANEAIDVMPDFLGYTKSMQRGGDGTGISKWWVVNYLKSLA